MDARTTIGTSAAVCFVALVGAASGQVCQPRWESDLGGASLNGGVEALRVMDSGGGAPPWLGVGGSFTSVAGVPIERVARFDGTEWWAIGDGIAAPNWSPFGCCAKVNSLAVFDGGAGPAVHVGGDFIYAGVTQQLTAESVARWQAGQWHSLTGGLYRLGCADCGARVYALNVWDDGSGPALYAGGSFDLSSSPGGMLNNVAEWDGKAWHTLAFGVVSYRHEEYGPAWVSALASFDDGSGARLYASGQFNEAGGVQGVHSIARWDGSAWSPLGQGLGPNGEDPPFAYGFALQVFDDGSGPALYAGGEFSLAGGQPASNIARWDGTAWSAVGSGVNGPIRCTAVFDDGSGPALYVGGDFTEAGGKPAQRIARWDGVAWSALGDGLDGGAYAMAAFATPQGPTLVVGGWFSQAGGQSSPYLARWTGCASCYPDCNGDGSLTVADFGCFQTRFVQGDPQADCNGDGQRTVADFGCFQTRFVAGCP